MGGRRKKTPKTKMQVLAEELARDLKTPEDLSAFSAALTKLTVEAALQGELDPSSWLRATRDQRTSQR